MKCPKCEKDCTRKEREDSGGRCPGCGRKFALDPGEEPKVSDYTFHKVVERLSEAGALYYSRDQLRHAIEARLRKGPGTAGQVGGAGCGIFFLLFMPAIPVALFVLKRPWMLPILGISALIVTIVIARAVARRIRSHYRLDRGLFTKLLSDHAREHGQPRHMVVARTLDQPGRKEAAQRLRDLSEYAFDRLVVLDDPLLVDVLVKNRFHFEYNAAVIALEEDGTVYPAEVGKVALELTRRHPDVQIFHAHAYRPGVDPAGQVKKVLGGRPVIQVGLSAGQIRKLGLATEASWELALLGPRRLATLLANAFMAKVPAAAGATGDAGGVVVVDTGEDLTEVAFDFG